MGTPSTYREWPAPAGLAGAVACVWSHRLGDEAAGPVLPDGCSDVIWRQGDGAFVAGPDTGPVPMTFTAGTLLIGLRFRPGAGGAGLGLPLDELRDRRVPVADLSPSLEARLHPDLTPAEAERALTRMATEALDGTDPDPVVAEAVAVLADPDRRLADARTATGVSERQLRRRFRAAAGYGPKTLQRILRFRAFLDHVDAGDDLATAAATSGYADQPHLNRESRTLAGLTPAEIVAVRN